jgi:hypothetical protein
MKYLKELKNYFYPSSVPKPTKDFMKSLGKVTNNIEKKISKLEEELEDLKGSLYLINKRLYKNGWVTIDEDHINSLEMMPTFKIEKTLEGMDCELDMMQDVDFKDAILKRIAEIYSEIDELEPEINRLEKEHVKEVTGINLL